MQVHPLKFEPIFKRRVWGGRALESLLGKPLPPGERVGESWELADLEQDQSVVAAGPAAGRTLNRLVNEWGCDLTGRAELAEGRFPLLLKFLDAREVLSVQVHPDEAYVARHGGDARVKHEAWYVVHADPGGCIYRGLKPGVSRARFEDAIKAGNAQNLINRIAAKPGRACYLPGGTVHALGAGVLVAEIQTPSDTTFRVFDWNRVDPATGGARELHVEQALECIHFDESSLPHDPPRGHVASLWTAVTRLVACPFFTVEKVRMVQGMEQDIPYAEPVVWMILQGAGVVLTGSDRTDASFRRGDTLLLPAALRAARVRTDSDCVWLEITIPAPSDLAAYARPSRGELRDRTPAPPSRPIRVQMEKGPDP